jgi:N-acetyl sugar amidotransferase
MDTSDNFITFDKNGVCNHCHEYDRVVKATVFKENTKKERLQKLVEKIKKAGEGKKYDCIAGLSGGMDSSYVLYLAKKHDLRTLIVHFDNGWDSELAINNIENIITTTGFDYYNYVVDWEEFRNLQLSYFKASVVDVEVPTDMGIFSLLPQVALKYDIPNILIGHNLEAEFTMGKNWNYTKMDRGNLEGIHKAHGTKKLKTFPYYTPYQQFKYQVKGVKKINMLWYDECNYSVIEKKLSDVFGWKNYSVKHGESVFTKFYQSYYLPKKFGIDKRRAHLADQINANHKSREEAVEILQGSVYSSLQKEKKEYDYVVKKLGLSHEEFDEIMESKIKSHYDYPTNKPYGNTWDKIFLKILKVKIIVSGFRRLNMLFE